MDAQVSPSVSKFVKPYTNATKARASKTGPNIQFIDLCLECGKPQTYITTKSTNMDAKIGPMLSTTRINAASESYVLCMLYTLPSSSL